MNGGRTDAIEAPESISIITPSLNQAPYLRETLESVAQQDYPRIEHIVMDGGSTDGSVDLLQRWSHDHNVQWQSGPDGGQAQAIAAGIRRSTGDIATWLNSDDIYLDQGVISAVMRAFQSGASVVTGAGWYLSESGARLRRISVHSDRLRFRSLRHVDWVLQPATFFRREVVVRHPIDTTLTYAFDWDLFIRISQEFDFTPIERDLAGYRLHPGGKTISGSTKRKRELLEVTRRYSGETSPQYQLLRLLVAGYEFADRLPEPLRRMRSLFTGIALLSHRLPGGRGVQF